MVKVLMFYRLSKLQYFYKGLYFTQLVNSNLQLKEVKMEERDKITLEKDITTVSTVTVWNSLMITLK